MNDSDGVFSAIIWDVAVTPVWQRSGLGRAMMERLTRDLVEDGIPTIALYAEPKVCHEPLRLFMLEVWYSTRLFMCLEPGRVVEGERLQGPGRG